jgi:ACS family hexuronate transporter-like MFS transporter
LEANFGMAFAIGALFSGWLVDRVNVYWVYPIMVSLWSLAGVATGFARDYSELMLCRVALGFFEAANWPCALRTTQRLLRPEDRSLGNGILQSGTAIGSVITPLVVQLCLNRYDDWRPAFIIIGAIGFIWVAVWLYHVHAQDLSLTTLPPSTKGGDSIGGAIATIVSDRRFWVLAVVVVSINLTWHFFRPWAPLFLQNQHHYSEQFTNYFSSGYYLAADVGAWAAGGMALFLVGRGYSVHASRVRVFMVCACLTLLSLATAVLPAGPLLLATLLVIGFASLGLFPNYYSFSQEITARHQGKVTGLLGCTCWLAVFFMQRAVGDYVKQTQEYSRGIALAGIPPIIAFAALAIFWRESDRSKSDVEPSATPADRASAAEPSPIPSNRS